MLLSLPSLSPKIPPHFELGAATEVHLRLALGMSQAKLVLDDDLDALSRGPVNAGALRRLIESAWKRRVGDGFEYEVLGVDGRLYIPNAYDLANDFQMRDAEGKPRCVFILDCGRPEWIRIGAMAEAAEALHSGLGAKVLDALETVLWRFGQTFTPAGAFSMAQHLYWQGEEDESVVLEEYGEEEMGDIVRRAEIFKDVPEWAWNLHNGKKRMKNSAFHKLAKKHAKSPLGGILHSLSKLIGMTEDDEAVFPQPCEEGDVPADPPVVLCWDDRDPDPIGRVFDDYWNYWQEGEGSPYTAAIHFSLSPEGIAEAVARICHTARVLKQFDEVLVQIRDFRK